MSEPVGPVRDEAERLVEAVLERWPAYDAERAERLAAAVGDVAVAVTGLLRELSRDTSGESAAGLRQAFVGLTAGLLDAAGVDPEGEPSRREPDPWQAATRDAQEEGAT